VAAIPSSSPDLRDLQNNYYQARGGAFTFDNLFTSQNALSAGATATALPACFSASGRPEACCRSGFPGIAELSGYFAQDTWQVTNKLTLTVECAGKYRVFTRNGITAPRLQSLRGELSAPGGRHYAECKPILGALDFIKTPQHPEQGLKTEHFSCSRRGWVLHTNE